MLFYSTLAFVAAGLKLARAGGLSALVCVFWCFGLLAHWVSCSLGFLLTGLRAHWFRALAPVWGFLLSSRSHVCALLGEGEETQGELTIKVFIGQGAVGNEVHRDKARCASDAERARSNAMVAPLQNRRCRQGVERRRRHSLVQNPNYRIHGVRHNEEAFGENVRNDDATSMRWC